MAGARHEAGLEGAASTGRRAAGRGVCLSLYLVRLRLMRVAGGLGALLVLLTLAGLDHLGLLLADAGDMSRYHDRWVVVDRVLDGDTLLVRWQDGPAEVTRVRLWGVDTPELARQGREEQPLAAEAKQWVEEAIRGGDLAAIAGAAGLAGVAGAGGDHGQGWVRIRLTPEQTRDRFGRLLGYVELPGGASLNEGLLVVGLARADDRFDHPQRERFTQLDQQARRDGVGLWAK